MKSRKVLIGLLTTLLASSCSLVIKPVRPSTPSSQPTSSSVKPSTSSSASSSTSSSASSSSSSSSSKEDSSSISSPSSSSSSNSSATTNEQNVAQINAVKEAINAIGSVTLESLDLIANAESLLNALAPELKAEVGSELLEKLAKARNDYDALVAKAEADAKAIKEVEDAINAIGTVTLESSKAIADAEGLFEALSDELEAKVSAELKEKLNKAREDYDALVAKAEAEAKAIKAVEDAIKEIGTVTLESLSKIENAESLLNELDDSLEAKVSSELKEDLVAAREEYNRLVKEKEEAENTAKVNAVKDAINAIGNVTLDSKDEIDAAYDLYNALPDNLKELVDASLLKLLEDAKKDYEDLLAADLPDSVVFEFGENEPGIVHDKSNNLIHGDGAKVESNKDYTVNGVTITVENPVNFYDGAFDNLGNSAIKLGTSSKTASFALIVPEGVNKVILNIAAYKNKTSKIIINNVEYELKTSSNNGEYTPIEIDTSKDNAIGIETVSSATRCMINSIELVVRENTVDPDLELIESVETLINNLGTITLDSKEALDAAIKAFDDLTDAQEAKVDDEVKAKLEEAKETYDALVAEKEAEEKAIKAVEDAINAIGDVTLNSLSAIENAEKLLAELDDELEAKVDATLKEALVKARKDYEDLVADASADAIAIARVEVFINRIGTVTLDSKEVLEAAEEAYAALDEDLKEQVDATLRQNLLDARAAYDALIEQDKIDAKAAEDFTALVEAIGTVEEDDLERIEAAEAALKQLTDAQLAKVNEEVLEKLENARKEYDSLTGIDISKVLTAEEAMEYMKSDAYVEFTVLHVTGVIIEVTPTNHGYDIVLENGFEIYSGKLKDGLNIPKVGYTVTASGKAKIYNGTYEIAWDSSHNENPSIYDVDRNSTPEQDAAMIKDVVDAIELIGEITLDNYKEKLEAIKTAEQLLKDLPIDLKDDVDAKLVEDLEEARKAYDEFTVANAGETISFEFGENGEAKHYDGNTTAITAPYEFNENEQKLVFTSTSKVYVEARDAKGNSCIKLGTSSAGGSFTFVVPNNVEKVTIYVSGRNSKSVNVSVNGGEAITISTLSDNGEYTPIEIDTTTNKTVTFASLTNGADERCMINSIKFELSKEEVDADQAAVNSVEYAITSIGDLTLENFESKKAAIEAADAAYNALTAEQQAKVNPDSVKALNDAKAKYEELVLEKEALDAAAVKAVKDAINALEYVTLEDLEAIEEVEYAYKNLSEDLQKQIDEELVNRLKAIREEYEALYETSLPLEEGLLAAFEFGANSSVGHVDGNKVNEETGKSYPEGEYTLTLTDVKAVYDGGKDEKGKSVLKLGTSNNAATLTFKVSEDVTSVVILVANYKANKATITINDENYELENSSNEGKYDVITIDTTTTKSITLATGASNEKRCMINTIKFFGEESQTPVDPNPDQPEPEDPTPDPDQPEVSNDGNLWTESSEGNYYAGLEGYKGYELNDALKELLTTTQEETFSYEKVGPLFAYTDLGPTGQIMTFYAHSEFLLEWNGQIIDKEHVWPQSLGWFSESGAGSDLHHLRPTIKMINTLRNNNPFGEVSTKDETTDVVDNGHLGGYLENGVFEPLDESKGDVARILLYLLARYNDEYEAYRQTEGGHDITDVITSMDLLLEWNELDPVDSTEMQRNDRVAEKQGNRNPFIDHPEFANMIYDENYDGEGALIDTNGGNKLMSDDQKVQFVIDAINEIGEVTLESKNKILKAENLLASLSNDLQAKVENKTELSEKRAQYDKKVEEENQEKPLEPSTLAYIDFGAKGAEAHVDGNDYGTSKSFTEGSYTLTLSNMSKVFGPAYDAKGNSCIKLGTEKVAGTFTFTVPAYVTEVKIYVGKYKANSTNVSVNGENYTLTKNSNNGEYDEIVVNTSTNKTVTFTTCAGGYRCMVNAIELIKDENYVEPENPGQGGGDVVEPENPTVTPTGTLVDAVIDNKVLPDSLTYISGSAAFYADCGLKLNSVGKGVKTQTFNEKDSINVKINIKALNANQKSSAEGDHIFTIKGYNASGSVVATEYIDNIAKPGDYSVELNGDGIVYIEVIMTGYPNNGTKYCYVSLGGVKVEG